MSRILVVEDSGAIALLLKRRLEAAGHEVAVANSASDALRQLESGPATDLILADVMMPGMDGLEFTSLVRSRLPELPVILVTGQELPPEAARLADAVVGKPIEFDRLLEEVRRLGGNHPSP